MMKHRAAGNCFFNTAVDDRWLAVNSKYIHKLLFMNKPTDRQTEEFHVHLVYVGLPQARPKYVHCTLSCEI